MSTRYADGAYDAKPEEKEAYEEAVYDVWWLFQNIRDNVENDFLTGKRSLNNAAATKDGAQKAIYIIEKEYPELFKEEE